jgi:hypothetical protein
VVGQEWVEWCRLVSQELHPVRDLAVQCDYLFEQAQRLERLKRKLQVEVALEVLQRLEKVLGLLWVGKARVLRVVVSVEVREERHSYERWREL